MLIFIAWPSFDKGQRGWQKCHSLYLILSFKHLFFLFSLYMYNKCISCLSNVYEFSNINLELGFWNQNNSKRFRRMVLSNIHIVSRTIELAEWLGSVRVTFYFELITYRRQHRNLIYIILRVRIRAPYITLEFVTRREHKHRTSLTYSSNVTRRKLAKIL